MRLMLATAFVASAAVAVWAQAEGAGEAERAAAAAKLAKTAAERYAFTREGNTPAPLALDPKPLLQWSNPVAGSIHGSVFVWTDQGRPQLVASIYKWYGPSYFHLAVELHSLVEAPIVGRNGDAVVWSPGKAGIAFAPVPGAPAVGETPKTRLRQMRALANEFTATEVDRQGQELKLRLLTQPVYRYDSAETPASGTLFAFVKATDPELILLLEARRGTDGTPAWHYAAARMNSVALRLEHKGRELWSALEWPWRVVYGHGEPYTVFKFEPGQGIVPAEKQ